MAYRRSKGKGRRKNEPAVMNMSFTGVATGTNYIDLSMAASILNRRSYKQGINWTVAGFTITTAGLTAPGTVTVCKVPTTWVAYNAWVKSKAMWDKMNDQVLDEEPSIEAKYADFKVALNALMVEATVQGNILLPTSGQILVPTDCTYSNPSTNGSEWVYSRIQIPTDGGSSAPVEHMLHFVGPDDTTATDSVGMIHGYAMSRARPVNTGEPSVPADGGWMQELFDVADNLEEIRDDIGGENDRPPYPVGNSASSAEYYPGGANHLPGTEVVGYASFGGQASTGSITAQRSIRGGQFPCGLLELKSTLVGPAFYDIIVHMVPGPHRGYLCEPMQDV